MSTVINRTTLQVINSVYLPDYPSQDWIHNPDLSPVDGVPEKYWKIISDQVLEMTQGEKDAADLTLEYLDLYGYNGKDYKVVRQKIIEGVIGAGGFSNLSTDEKEIAARWFAVVKADRDTVYTTEQQVQLGLVFHTKSVEARQARSLAVVMEIYNRLSKSDADDCLGDVVSNQLDYYYSRYGREGTESGDPEGIYDYFQSVSETTWASTGLSSKTYTPVSGTLSELVDRIMDILKNGNY